MVERRREWNDSVGTHQPERRSHAYDSTECSGLANRACGIGSDGSKTHPACDRGSRAPGGSARNVVGIYRVVNGTKAADHGTPAVSELVQVLLANEDRSSLL